MEDDASSENPLSSNAVLTDYSKVRQRKTNKAKRFMELDALRGWAIFGVLVLHSSFEGRFSEQTLAIQAELARFFDWAVLAFFFSSGFLYNRSSCFASTVRKRIMSLIIPFFFYNVVYNLCFAAAHAMGWFQPTTPGLISLRFPDVFFRSPGFQLYFLPYLFLIFVTVRGLDALNPRHPERIYPIILAAVLGFYVWNGYPEFSHGPAVTKLPLYLAMFLVGVISRPFLENRVVNAYLIATILGIIFLILVFSPLPVVSLVVPPLLVCFVRAFPKMGNLRLVLTMGKMSGSIYVWHTPLILPAFTKLLSHLGMPSVCVLFGSLALTLAACIFLRYETDRFCEHIFGKPVPRFITL